MTYVSSTLVTRPDYEPTTRYISSWAKKFIEDIENNVKNIYELKDERANKIEFEGMIAKNKPFFVYLNGHGTPSSVLGHNDEVICDLKNIHILKGCVVYAFSCSSANILGSEAVKKHKIRAYVGYVQDFIFAKTPEHNTHPKDDELARLFLDPANKIAMELAKGKSAKEAVEIGKEAFQESIDRALNSDVQSDDDKFVPFLIWNKASLIAHTK